MNTAHWHLLLNHLPIMGTVIGTLILAAGYIMKNSVVRQTALGVFVFSALMVIPAYLTGEGAEEIAEKLPGVTDARIESHEDLGKYFLFAVLVLGVLSVITFLFDRMKNATTSVLYGSVLIVAIRTSIFGKQVATSGGEVRHTEIRSGSTAADQNTDPNQKDDDD